ncbi:MAG: heme-binding protein [Pseudomonas sp.]|uniref:SOUL family heme-binding protein n=1 Tax=Pseudomonas sp. TaxID=306 RepID=UPI0027236913|nr:heme-binding protein [Pseudomonas sp.]MDO9619073.1 heme-binding protein [Pseudomonas sp.]
MKSKAFFAALLLIIGMQETMAVEEASYVLLKSDGKFEVREYAPHVLAETLVTGDLESAGGKAFQTLFGYISGDNVSRTKVAMTAPVSQVPASEKIQMTAPVGQQRVEEQWAVSFMMPKSYTLSTLPQPKDPSVVLRQVPAQKMAVVRYSGTWSEKNYSRHKSELEAWVRKNGLTASGSEIWARYNAPFTPWFLRRNEVLIPVK